MIWPLSRSCVNLDALEVSCANDRFGPSNPRDSLPAFHESSTTFRSISFPSRARARSGLHWPCRRELLRPARSGYRTVPAVHRSEVYVPCFDTRFLRRRDGASSWLDAADSALDFCHPHVGRIRGRGLSNVSSVLSGSVGREMQREPVLHAGQPGGDRRVGAAASCFRGLLGHVVQGSRAHLGASVIDHVPNVLVVARDGIGAPTGDCLTGNPRLVGRLGWSGSAARTCPPAPFLMQRKGCGGNPS